MIIPVDIPDDIFWKLAGAAERSHTKVKDLLRTAAHDLADGERVSGNRWRGDQERALVLMVRAGWTDAAIAASLGFSRGAVSDRRRLLGIVKSRTGRPSCVVSEQTKKEKS